jgi:hypothetical protein
MAHAASIRLHRFLDDDPWGEFARHRLAFDTLKATA